MTAAPEWERVEIPATRCPRIAPAFLEEERRQMGDWWLRQACLCEFVATTDQVFAYDLVTGALSDEVAPLFLMARTGILCGEEHNVVDSQTARSRSSRRMEISSHNRDHDFGN